MKGKGWGLVILATLLMIPAFSSGCNPDAADKSSQPGPAAKASASSGSNNPRNWPLARKEAVLKSYFVGFPYLKQGFGAIEPAAEHPTWDELSEQERAQLLEIITWPNGLGNALVDALKAGVSDPESLSLEELAEIGGDWNLFPVPRNLYRDRPVDWQAWNPSPGDLLVHLLSVEEAREYLKNNGGPEAMADCPPDYFYWRAYGDGGRVIAEYILGTYVTPRAQLCLASIQDWERRIKAHTKSSGASQKQQPQAGNSSR